MALAAQMASWLAALLVEQMSASSLLASDLEFCLLWGWMPAFAQRVAMAAKVEEEEEEEEEGVDELVLVHTPGLPAAQMDTWSPAAALMFHLPSTALASNLTHTQSNASF